MTSSRGDCKLKRGHGSRQEEQNRACMTKLSTCHDWKVVAQVLETLNSQRSLAELQREGSGNSDGVIHGNLHDVCRWISGSFTVPRCLSRGHRDWWGYRSDRDCLGRKDCGWNRAKTESRTGRRGCWLSQDRTGWRSTCRDNFPVGRRAWARRSRRDSSPIGC